MQGLSDGCLPSRWYLFSLHASFWRGGPLVWDCLHRDSCKYQLPHVQEANLGSLLSAQDEDYLQPFFFILLHLSLHAPEVCVLQTTASVSEQRLVNGCCPGFAGRKSWMVQSEMSSAPAFWRHLQTTCLVWRPVIHFCWILALEHTTLFCFLLFKIF